MTHYAASFPRVRASPGRRAAAFLLAIALEVLLLLAFLTLNFRERAPRFEGGRLTTFDVAANRDTAEPQATPERERQTATATPIRVRPVPPVPTPRIELPSPPLQMIEVSRETYIASDIAKLGTAAGNPRSGPQLAGSGRSPGDSERVGTGPDGQPLYAAEWYREPTNQELSAYLPKTMPEGGGWGLIACKTAEGYRVIDCVELANSPPGSHLAGAVRQAAWQFRVRPPRIGGKPMIGEWVRIRIDYLVGSEGTRVRPSRG